MQSFLVIFTAAALSGLMITFGLHLVNPIPVESGNVFIPIDVFVGLIAVLTLSASSLSLLLRARLRHSEVKELNELRERIARLETGAG